MICIMGVASPELPQRSLPIMILVQRGRISPGVTTGTSSRCRVAPELNVRVRMRMKVRMKVRVFRDVRVSILGSELKRWRVRLQQVSRKKPRVQLALLRANRAD